MWDRTSPIPPAEMSRLSDILERHTIALCVLFGSRARGDGTAGSDRDLGVLRRDRRSLSFRELGVLKLDLEDLFTESVDVVDLTTPDVALRMEVAREGVVGFAEPPELWADFVAKALVDHDDLGPWLEACVRGVGRAVRARRVS